jgi:hypothetical protein
MTSLWQGKYCFGMETEDFRRPQLNGKCHFSNTE